MGRRRRRWHGGRRGARRCWRYFRQSNGGVGGNGSATVAPGGGGGGSVFPFNGLGGLGGAGGRPPAGSGVAPAGDGGNGGDAGAVFSTSGSITTPLRGGYGGNGVTPQGLLSNLAASGGGGGEGGPGAVVRASTGRLDITSDVNGGDGGAGGNGGSGSAGPGGAGGGGGEGGAAIVVQAQVPNRPPVVIRIGPGVSVLGGNGGRLGFGNFGATSSDPAGPSGRGGEGGTGVVLGANNQLINEGFIAGGFGQLGGPGSVGVLAGANSTTVNLGVIIGNAQGVGVVLLQGASLVNGGSISGGDFNVDAVRLRGMGSSLTMTTGGELSSGLRVEGGITARLIGDGYAGAMRFPIVVEAGATLLGNATDNANSPNGLRLWTGIGGAGNFTWTGGRLLLTGTSSPSTLTGTTTVQGGEVTAAGPVALSPASPLVVAPGGLLSVGFSQSVPSLAGGGSIALGDSARPGRVGFSVGSNNQPSAFGGSVTGSGDLVKVGSGAFTLTGTVGADVTTTVSAGRFDIGNGGSSGAVQGPIVNDALLRFNRSGASEHAGTITGSGVVQVAGTGTLTLSGDNGYTGGTALKQGRLDVGHANALGTGELAMDSGTTLGFAADGLRLANDIRFTSANDPTIDSGAGTATLAGRITGPGDLSKTGPGVLVLAGANTYAGATQLLQGTLRAAAADRFSAASVHQVAAGTTLDTGGFDQRVAALANAGTVSLVGAVPGSSLTVTGPYVGSGAAVLRLGVALGDSASATDRLVLSGPGASAAGRTTLQVVNLGGLGALTTGSGIEVVRATGGATTTAQSTKDAFALPGGRIDAGAFAYRLQPGDAAGAGESWYLSSFSTAAPPPSVAPPAAPAPPAPPPAVGGPSYPGLPLSPAPAPDTGSGSSAGIGSPSALQRVSYRAEVPLLAILPAQTRQANLLMLGDLHRRVGDDAAVATSASDATGPADRRAWGRVLGAEPDIRQRGTADATSRGRLTGFQAGTDLWANGDWRGGVYVGQLDGDQRVSGFAFGIPGLAVGRTDLRNRYVGGYATWHGASGWYADAVLQAGRHRYGVDTGFGGAARGEGRSVLASIEVGRAFSLAPGWTLEPQMQLVHQRLRFDPLAIAGAQVRQDATGGWLLRAGLRVKGEFATPAGSVQPYLRANVYRTGGGDDVASFENPAAVTPIDSRTGGSARELAGGATLTVSERTSVYGELGERWGSGALRAGSGVQGSVGVRVRW